MGRCISFDIFLIFHNLVMEKVVQPADTILLQIYYHSGLPTLSIFRPKMLLK